MKEKYYTPKINEFYVGFEFEYLEDDGLGNLYWTYNSFCETINPDINSYIKKSVLWGFMELNKAIENEEIRVKYLDEEDILSLGFEKRVNVFYIQDQKYQLDYLENFDKWYIFENTDDDMICLFQGKIKNKHELEVILKQIGVL